MTQSLDQIAGLTTVAQRAAWLTMMLNRHLLETYTVRYVEAPSPDVDDEFEVLLDGKETGWTLQCGLDGGFAVNEHGGAGADAWMKDHGHFTAFAGASSRLVRRLYEAVGGRSADPDALWGVWRAPRNGGWLKDTRGRRLAWKDRAQAKLYADGLIPGGEVRQIPKRRRRDS